MNFISNRKFENKLGYHIGFHQNIMLCTLKLIRSSLRFFSVQKFAKTEVMNQGKCYLRFIPATENDAKVDINFLLQVKDNIWRQFNLCRKPTETLDVLLNRIEKNVEKVVVKKKKNVNCNDTVTAVSAKMFNEHKQEIPKTLLCGELFQLSGHVTLEIYNSVLDVVLNPPWVLNIALPKSVMAGFPVFPENFASQNTVKSFNIFNWYTGVSVNLQGNEIAEQHIDWKLVGNDFIYVPCPSDINLKLKLKCTPANEVTTGPSVEVTSPSTIQAGPGQCPFETRHQFTTTKLKDRRCVTYNILADLYCDSDFTRTTLHPYCPPYALHIDYRKQLIIKELTGYNADVMCLQEVDMKVFNSFLQPILDASGLNGLFYKKGKTVSEGLACFYRRDRFKLLFEKRIFLAEALTTESCFTSIWEGIKDNKPLLTRLLDRSTVASASVLESIDNPGQILLVGNTHLYFHPDADHIRLLQGGMIIYWLQSIKQDIEKEYTDKNVNLIVCGDFNSTPTYGLYQLYTTGSAPSDLRDWRSNENEVVENVSLNQNVPLASACGTPEYTNFTAEFVGCLDYIFYDKTNICVQQVVPLPADDEVKANVALPSVVFPSDHISLVADLQFMK